MKAAQVSLVTRKKSTPVLPGVILSPSELDTLEIVTPASNTAPRGLEE
jgi:hypothetical protein